MSYVMPFPFAIQYTMPNLYVKSRVCKGGFDNKTPGSETNTNLKWFETTSSRVFGYVDSLVPNTKAGAYGLNDLDVASIYKSRQVVI